MIVMLLSLSLFGLNLQLVEQNASLTCPLLAKSSLAGTYYYQAEYTTQGLGETPIKSFSLFDREHRLLATLQQPGIEMVFISDAGWFVGGLNSGDRIKLQFFDRSGQIRARTEASAPANYAFSAAGNYFYVNDGHSLQAFDALGRISGRFGTGAWFLPSPDDRFVATVDRDQVDVYRLRGHDSESCPLLAAPFFSPGLGTLLFRTLAFSPREDYLAVAERSSVTLYALKRRTLLWQKQFDSSVSLLALAVSDNGRVYAGGETGRQGFLSVLANGVELARAEVAYTEDHETINRIALTDTSIRVLTSDHEFEYREQR